MDEYQKETKKERFWARVLNILIATIIVIYFLANDFEMTKHVILELLRVLIFLAICFCLYKLVKYVNNKLFYKKNSKKVLK